MARCSECGGQITSLEHAIYRLDGARFGEYSCGSCGKTKGWSRPGHKEEVIDMS